MTDFLSTLAERALGKTQTARGVESADRLRPVSTPLFAPNLHDPSLSDSDLEAEIHVQVFPSPATPEPTQDAASLAALEQIDAVLNVPHLRDIASETQLAAATQELPSDMTAPSPSHTRDSVSRSRNEPLEPTIVQPRPVKRSEDDSKTFENAGEDHLPAESSITLRPSVVTPKIPPRSTPKLDIPETADVVEAGAIRPGQGDIEHIKPDTSEQHVNPTRPDAKLVSSTLRPQIQVLPPRPNKQDDNDALPTPPPIQVSIGRIEIRATTAPPAPPAKPRPKGIMSLDDYLRRRRGGDI